MGSRRRRLAEIGALQAIAKYSGLKVTHLKAHGALNNMAHLRILSLPYTAPGRSLTKRQREVLEWVGDGKTMQDYLVGWIESDTPTFCVDVSGNGDEQSGTGAAWGLCP